LPLSLEQGRFDPLVELSGKSVKKTGVEIKTEHTSDSGIDFGEQPDA